MRDAAAVGRSEEQQAERKAGRGGGNLSYCQGELFVFCIPLFSAEITFDKDKDKYKYKDGEG